MPSATIWILLPSGTISTPSLYHLTGASSLQFLMISFRFLPSATIWILLPSGTISTPSLYHLTGASSSSTPNSKTAVSSSTTFLPFSLLVNACWNSAISTLHVVTLAPSFPKSWISHLYSPESPNSADLMSRVQTPSSFFIKNLASLGLISTPSLNHFTLALGSSTLHFSCTFLFVFPFLSFNLVANPNSGSGGSTSRYPLHERSLHSRTVHVYRPVSPVSGFLMMRVKVSSSFSNPNLGPL